MFLSATVRLTSSRSCFVCLSADLAQRLPTASKGPGNVVVFQLEWPGGLAYISWSGDTAINRSAGFGQTQTSVVEIGKKFADLNGIRMGEQVVLTPLDSITSCTRVHVDPLSTDDWEILELHAGFVESNLLNQVRVVWRGQVVPVWINKNACIAISIDDVEPVASCVVLEEFTEVIITPKQRQFGSTNQQSLTSTQQQSVSQLQEKYQETNPDGRNSDNLLEEESTFKSSLLDLWNYLLGRQENITEENSEFEPMTSDQNEVPDALNYVGISSSRNCCKSAFAERELDLCLRSQLVFQDSVGIEDGDKVLCTRQSSCVFVNPDAIGLNHLICNQRHYDNLCLGDFERLQKIVTIRKLLSPKEKLELLNIGKKKGSKETEVVEENSRKMSEILQKPIPVRMLLSSRVLPGHIIMHQQLHKQLGAGGISVFLVSHTKQGAQELQGIVLHPVKDPTNKTQDPSSQDIIDSFCHWVSMVTNEEYPLLIWNEITITFDCCGCSLEFIVTVLSHAEDTKESDCTPYYNVTPSLLEGIKVVVGDEKPLPKIPTLLWQIQSENTAQLTCAIKDLGGFSQPFDKCLNHLLVSLEESPLPFHLSGGHPLPSHLSGGRPLPSHLSGGLTIGLGNGAVLICGNGVHVGEGCGKTSLGHALCHELQKWPVGAHVVVIDCIPLRGKRVETIQKHWHQAFLEAAWHQPSVILLDNLDHVISAPSLGQEMGGEGLYRLRLVQVLKDLVTAQIANKSKIAAIATSRSHDSLHGALQSGHGLHVFQCYVELGPLNETQRLEVLLKLIQRKCHDHTELETIAKSVARRSEGFSPKDLNALADRALHFAVVRQMKSGKGEHPVNVVLDDFHQALSGYSPASLRGVQLHKPGELSWLDVGGLMEVRKALQETLLWPTKYAALFAKCPLRLRSGLLLYGPPGTGKTLLAGVIAKESGLNFISIKGPELLSKYIGASEQAVRDVFTRAETARPCILFFDEFDALAPRRGHDSTGVTDRVVNQLLTQLDGVEGLEGVYILAATSRPGLIDPALLRPGRLDKCIYCPIPNESERLEILHALTRNLTLADDADLRSMASKCEHFTGADLKALLYNAQLESIHRKTSRLQLYGNIFSETDEVIKAETRPESSVEERGVIAIQQSDFEKAVSSMRPSVSPDERLMYGSIYDSFKKTRGNSFTKNLPVGGKATLA